MRDKEKIIFIAGDSTAEIKTKEERPESGWGEFLAESIRPDFIVKNHAMGGRSTKSFLDQNRLQPILKQIQAGDYLLIQFGHNDQKIEDPERYTDPFAAYQENLIYFVNSARERMAQPVLISSITRRDFINGKVNSQSLGDYPKAMKEVAETLAVPFIDMHQLSMNRLNEIGEEKSKELYLHLKENEYENYPNGLIDNTHFSTMGAKTFAEMIANELASLFDEINTIK